MTSQTQIRSDLQDGILTLTLDGPKSRNAIGPHVYQPLQAALIDAAQDPAVRCVVLTGAGGFFCSGGDVNALKDSANETMAQVTARTDGLNAAIRAVRGCRVPVIAAVEGGAAGAGLSLALACDMIVAAEAAKFVAAYVRVGLTPDGGATWFLREALPHQLVMELCTLGAPVSAERLAQFGVVNVLAAPETALEVATELARKIAAGPAQAIARIKAEIVAAPKNDLATHLNLEADGINIARFGPEAAEGLAAFLEKRTPVFGKE
ncbi:MAG: enoyl-CoA hydratase/isomerase family protein [Rhodobacter sp.]|nr:enoyl-CoA hydratase/isomerase family protein [Paracoccaceae bacterium]MCC0076568.1 enoyl-CoA hydratase/isomerase family protein [Rhodobacter sp.]